MAVYANQLKKYAKQLSTERLIKAFGVEKFRQMMEEVDAKVPKLVRGIDTSPLSKEEMVNFKKAMECNTWSAVGQLFNKNGTNGKYPFATLAFRYLKNLK